MVGREGFLHLTVEPVTDPGFRYAQILGIELMLMKSVFLLVSLISMFQFRRRSS
jgi:hypothetical protein